MKKITKKITKKISIITERKRIENKSKKQVLCTRRNKVKHCLTHCFHGIPHEREREKDACHLSTEMCSISGIFKVTCKLLNKKQRVEWIEKEMNL